MGYRTWQKLNQTLNLLSEEVTSFILFYFILLFFRAEPTAYGSSQARGQIRAAAASLHHSHSNMGSEPQMRPTPQLMAMPILSSLNGAKDRTHVLMYTGRFCYC